MTSIEDMQRLNARYDAGYRMGWRDAHRTTRRAHGPTRGKHERYAVGYDDGWEDGKAHPCPEWDDAHRRGSLTKLPKGCPWRPA